MTFALYLLLAILCGLAIFRLYLILEKRSQSGEPSGFGGKLMERITRAITKSTRAISGSGEQERRIRARYEELKARRLAREEGAKRKKENNTDD